MMINVWAYFHTLTIWMVPLVLGLVTAGIIMPFHSIMLVTGPSRRWHPLFFVLVNPVFEEVIFRLVLLGFFTSLMGFLPAVIVMSVFYSIYMAVIYGAPSMADGLILGILLSFAMLEFGFGIVVGAHIVYRLVFSV